MEDKTSPDYLTVAQICELFGMCRQTVCKHIRSGSIPSVKTRRGQYLIPQKFLEEKLRAMYTGAEQESLSGLTQGGKECQTV